MLVVTRRPREAVTIVVPPSDIQQVVEVFVSKTTPNSTRLGFVAEPQVKIVRNELRNQIREAKENH